LLVALVYTTNDFTMKWSLKRCIIKQSLERCFMIRANLEQSVVVIRPRFRFRNRRNLKTKLRFWRSVSFSKSYKLETAYASIFVRIDHVVSKIFVGMM